MSGSLLERIRAQREAASSGTARAPPVAAPTYYPEPQEPSTNRWSLNVAWPKFGSGGGNDDASEALLSTSDVPEEQYSMGRYLQTFVQDFYNCFRSMHPVAQGVLVLVLIYVAIKLL